MAAALLQAGRKLQQMIRIIPVHIGHEGTTQGEGAGLVEDHMVQTGGCFDHITTAEQPAAPCCQAGGHRDHSGGRQTQGTGTGDHQHGD